MAAWTPLKQGLFLAIWLAAIVSNIGSLMQSTGGAWLITTLTRSQLIISLMTAATSLPLVLLCLPGGALADIGDKKKLLIIGQIWMLIAAVLLAVLSFMHNITPTTLLLLTFIMGIGNAITFPSWMASMAEIVDQENLAKALTLNSLAYNISLVIGPLLAAVVLAKLAVGWIFIVNAISFLAIIAVLVRWKNDVHESGLPKEDLTTAIRSTFRYTKHHPHLKFLLYRVCFVVFFASAFWGLFPSVARFTLHISAFGFGILYGFMGLGSIVAAFALPKIQGDLTIDQRIGGATVIFALSLVMLAFPPFHWVVYLAMFGFGISWITLMASFNVFVQSVVGEWIKARAIGMYMVIFQSSMTIGSIVFGSLAGIFHNPYALLIAAAGMIVSLMGVRQWPLKTAEAVDVTAYLQPTHPQLLSKVQHENGPVLISIRYVINPHRAESFIDAASELGRIRRRDGAIRWSLYKDTEQSDTYIENFVVESWAEHLRQHARFTNDDKRVLDHVQSFVVTNQEPPVSHYIAKALYT